MTKEFTEEIKRHREVVKEMKKKWEEAKFSRENSRKEATTATEVSVWTEEIEQDERYITALTFFLSLADSYLACKGFPEEKEHDKTCSSRPEWYNSETNGACDCGVLIHNQALHLCRVSHLKVVEELKEENKNLHDDIARCWEVSETDSHTGKSVYAEIASLKKEVENYKETGEDCMQYCQEVKLLNKQIIELKSQTRDLKTENEGLKDCLYTRDAYIKELKSQPTEINIIKNILPTIENVNHRYNKGMNYTNDEKLEIAKAIAVPSNREDKK